MTLQTRKLTGVAPWPMLLLAGGEKVGKTWHAIHAAMSPLVDRCLWFPIGETDPDEYAALPGFDHDRFDLVLHEGTYRGLIGALDEALAAEQANPDGPATLWVVDSASRLWDVLSAMAQREQYERQQRKAAAAARNGRSAPAPDPEQKPAVDLWNVAADRWGHVVDALRAHRGPVVITARMELRAVMNDKGEPTKEKEQKILAHKSLPFDVDGIVEFPKRGEAIVTGLRSVRLAGTIGEREAFPDFTVDRLWRALGLDEQVGQRSYTAADTGVAAAAPTDETDPAPEPEPPAEQPPAPPAEAPDPYTTDDPGVIRGAILALCQQNRLEPRVIASRYASAHGGQQIGTDTDADRLRAFLVLLDAEIHAEPAEPAGATS